MRQEQPSSVGGTDLNYALDSRGLAQFEAFKKQNSRNKWSDGLQSRGEYACFTDRFDQKLNRNLPIKFNIGTDSSESISAQTQ